MVKISLESKIQHKHQHEILSTFMKITRVNKFKNTTKFNTNIINVMLSTFIKIENHKSKQWSSRHSLLSSSAFYKSGLQTATLRSKASSKSIY